MIKAKNKISSEKSEETSYKKQAIKAAEELHYSKSTISKLEKANTDGEIQRIMIGARKGINGNDKI